MKIHNYRIPGSPIIIGVEKEFPNSIPYVTLDNAGHRFSIPPGDIEKLGETLAKIGQELKRKYVLLGEDDIPF